MQTALCHASAALFFFEPRLQIGERIEGRGRCRVAAVAAAGGIFQLGVFVLVAIGAEQLPVAADGGIVIVVAVLVMHLEQLQIGMRESARATAADPRIHLERPLAITGRALVGIATRVTYDLIETIGGRGHGTSFGHAVSGVKLAHFALPRTRGEGENSPPIPAFPLEGGRGGS